jgi:hypothetical protein
MKFCDGAISIISIFVLYGKICPAVPNITMIVHSREKNTLLVN